MKLTIKEIEDITIQYCSQFTCFDLKKLNSGITIVCDDRRNRLMSNRVVWSPL